MSMKVTEKDYISLRILKFIKKQVHDKRKLETIKQNQELRKLGKIMVTDMISN
jgi:hypothetical protein